MSLLLSQVQIKGVHTPFPGTGKGSYILPTQVHSVPYLPDERKVSKYPATDYVTFFELLAAPSLRQDKEIHPSIKSIYILLHKGH